MTKHQINEKYLSYVQSQIADGLMPESLDTYTKRIFRIEDKIVKVSRYSESMKCLLTFSVYVNPGTPTNPKTPAAILEEANVLVNRLQAETEQRHSIDCGNGGKILTPAEKEAKEIEQLKKLFARKDREEQAEINKLKKLFKVA